MKNFLLFLFLVFGSANLKAQVPVLNVDSMISFCKSNLNYIDNKNALHGYYSLSKEGISIFSSAKDKAANKPELKLLWNEVNTFRSMIQTLPTDTLLKIYNEKKDIPFTSETNGKYLLKAVKQNKNKESKNLEGLRIALDPGHISFTMKHAQIEAKYLNFKKENSPDLKEDINIIEGNLTIATALLLKQKLEAEGAEVFMTREKPGYTAFGHSLDDWFKKFANPAIIKACADGQISVAEKNRLLKSSDRIKFQDYLKTADLIERARLINEFHPDFTLIIHYNVDEKNTGWNKPTTKDFNMVFVAGNIKDEYLNKKKNRLEFLRLMVTEDLPSSIRFSSHVINELEQELKVPTAKPEDADYLIKESLPTSAKGVYCRNLVLTRLIHGPIAYGESLYQDNLLECQMLNLKLYPITEELKTSLRVKQVAEAYYKSILKYWLERNNSELKN